MVQKSSASDHPALPKAPKPAFSFAQPPKVELDMGEASRLQGFKLNGSR